MKPPRIPPLIIDIVQSGLLACEGILFETRDSCPVCGGTLSGYDTKKKQFAVLLEGNTRHPVHIVVKRFSCRGCDTICFADEPFYPGTRIGSPLVDLCRTLGATMPFNRVAVNLLHLGIVIDRGTVRNYMHGSLVDYFTFRTRCPNRGGRSHPRDRNARCLWFPIRIPGSGGPSPSARKKE